MGTKEFDATAAGWVRYALLVCRLVHDAGIEDFDVEIWNELTFGTRFLDINNYYDKEQPKVAAGPDFLNRGGNCWELARRTVEAVKREYPKARCIWGFSNTTFYHCPIAKLPPGMDGQSYHPYGTGTRSLPEQETHPDHPEFNLEGFTPAIDIRMPEGWAHTFMQTECLMRHLNPAGTLAAAAGGDATVLPLHYRARRAAGGMRREGRSRAWQLKSLCLTRSLCLWLNKGVDVMHYFVAYDRDPLGFGLLPAGVEKLPAATQFDQVATPPLRALRNLTRQMADSVPLERPRPLTVEVDRAGRAEEDLRRRRRAIRRCGIATWRPCCRSSSSRTSSPWPCT